MIWFAYDARTLWRAYEEDLLTRTQQRVGNMQSKGTSPGRQLRRMELRPPSLPRERFYSLRFSETSAGAIHQVLIIVIITIIIVIVRLQLTIISRIIPGDICFEQGRNE